MTKCMLDELKINHNDEVVDIEAPMNLLTPKRLIQDEGVLGALVFFSRVLRSPGAHKRVHKIQRAFGKYGVFINSAALIAVKPR